MARQKRLPRINNWQFLARWVVGHMMSWGAFFVAAIPLFMVGSALETTFPMILDFFLLLAVAIGVGGFGAMIQKRLIFQRFGTTLSNWIPRNILAWFISAVLISLTADMYPAAISDLHVAAAQGMFLFTLPALLQAWMLRKHVDNSWLYVLASIAGTTAFALPLAASDADFFPVVFGYGIYAAVTGLSLLWIFGMTRTFPEYEDTISRLSDEYEDDSDDTDWYARQEEEKKYFIQG